MRPALVFVLIPLKRANTIALGLPQEALRGFAAPLEVAPPDGGGG